jgi:predicted nucleic acid-binding protein
MPDPQRVVVDTSCLIALSALSQLELLHDFYGRVLIPRGVAQEFGEPLPDWITLVDAAPLVVAALRESLDLGEAEVIAVAAEEQGSLAILDDDRARTTCRAMGVPLTGTLGVLLRAKREGRLPSLSAALDVLDTVGFYLSTELKARVRELAGE